MLNRRKVLFPVVAGLLVGVCLAVGCQGHAPPCDPGTPHEFAMAPHPPYVVEPPDILLIDAIRLIPRPPYRIAAGDSIVIQATNIPPEEPIRGIYGVAADGTVNLGFSYGSVPVAGMTLEEAQQAIDKKLRDAQLKNPQVRVSMGQIGGIQLIRGNHIVRQDGTVGLGIYGSVLIAGLTLSQARSVIEQYLSQFFVDPQISLDVYAYNSKFYYVIADGAGYGQQILRFPITGKETVLDAISQISGLPLVSSKHHIWVARPDKEDPCKETILPVKWNCLTKGGTTSTNYQLFPDDRVYVQSQALIRTNNSLTKAFAPIQQILGMTLLGSSTVLGIQYNNLIARTPITAGVIATPR